MIYLDYAATSFPKPPEVVAAVTASFTRYGGNPGRGAYPLGLAASRLLLETRLSLAKLFGAPKAENVVFTANATEAANFALKGLLQPGDHVLYSSLEHNAIWRPLMALTDVGVLAESFFVPPAGSFDMAALAQAIRPNTKLLVFMQASNVCGRILPIAEIGALAKQKGVSLLVDAAQSAGTLDIDVEAMGIDLLVFAGHKGLYGPMGIGGLYVREGLRLTPLLQGGTGSFSLDWQQPRQMPDRLESGTPNLPGIAGLQAALAWHKERRQDIRAHQQYLTQLFLEGLSKLPGVRIYGPPQEIARVPVVSVNLPNMSAANAAGWLSENYDICTRAGYHCAPLAHQTLGTVKTGTLRFSFGYDNTYQEVEKALAAIKAATRERA